MQTLLKTFAVVATLAASATFGGGIALAGGSYHWAYPDAFQSPVIVPSVPGGSGIPEQYR
jgi:hypothetical protein